MVDLTMSVINGFPTLVVKDDMGNTYHRIYMAYSGGIYRVFPGNYIKREFTDETLPEAIRVSVGLINAYNWPDVGDVGHGSNIVWTFRDDYPDIMFNIGWRHEDHYCLVLSDEVIRDLRGQVSDVVRGMSNDSRVKSKSEGKESS